MMAFWTPNSRPGPDFVGELRHCDVGRGGEKTAENNQNSHHSSFLGGEISLRSALSFSLKR